MSLDACLYDHPIKEWSNGRWVCASCFGEVVE